MTLTNFKSRSRKLTITVFMLLICTLATAQYNDLWVPDTISGTTFNLSLKDTFVQYIPGNQTITAGINGAFWGPTLIFQKGDTVHMNVQNNLNDSTTLHWHGMHLPAVMDGGPYQLIPVGTTWQPYWVVTNNAATFWYHPHLHRETQAQLTSGLGGFIIVRDATEAALPLPRTYGVDDFPIVLTSRSFDSATNAFTTASVYGDHMLTNGTLNAQVTLPKQYVRLRILNAEIERGYNLGFSDNRTFYIIGNDGGLLDTPVAVTRVKLLIGERAEILVNLGADAVGDSVNLEAFNAGQEFGFPGSEPATVAPFGSLLNNVDFPVLHILVGAATIGAVTALPATLVSNTYWTAADATVTRTIDVTGGTPGGSPFLLDNTDFAFGLINQKVGLNNIEEWTVTNNAVFGHSFHIHDVQFKLVARSTGAIASYESGWKDTYYLHAGETVSFVARFSDYADSVHPYMYHCHISPHEDGGMMGAFVVDSSVATGVTNVEKQITNFTLYPNPATNKLYVSLPGPGMQVYYVRIVNAVGKTMFMLPRPQLAGGIDISSLPPGDYFLQLTDDKTKQVITRKFIKDGNE